MILDCNCQNCHEFILQVDTETLDEPLVGSMFKAKPLVEWALFSPQDTGNDLICPICSWCFHHNGEIVVIVKGLPFKGTPSAIKDLLKEEHNDDVKSGAELEMDMSKSFDVKGTTVIPKKAGRPKGSKNKKKKRKRRKKSGKNKQSTKKERSSESTGNTEGSQ